MLPLVLPVCEDVDQIEFRDNEATRVHSKQGDTYGFIFAAGKGGWRDPGQDGCNYPLLSGPKFTSVGHIPDNMGLIYFYRTNPSPQQAVSPYLVEIKESDTVITTLYKGGYHPYLATPGKNVFTAVISPWKTASLVLEIEAGKTYYIKSDQLTELIELRLLAIDPEIALKEIADCYRKKELLMAN